jgi:hypothetical protein
VTGANGAVTAEMVEELLGLNGYVFEKLKAQQADLEHVYRVLHELQAQIGGTELHRLLKSHYIVSGIHKNSLDATMRTIELLVLPYAAELAEGSDQIVHAALTGLLKRSEIWHGYKNTHFDGWMSFARDPLMIRSASNELRAIAAVERSGLTRDIRDRVISRNNSPRTLMLSLNTPLHLLLESRPEQIDGIIDVIAREREIDGDRIAVILDSEAAALASGLL